MADINDLLVRIDATTEQLRRELKRAEQAVDAGANRIDRSARRIDMSFQRMQRSAMRLAGPLAAAFSVEGIRRFTMETVRSLDEINNRAQVANVTTETLQRLRFAFSDLAGLAAGEVDSALQRFNRRLGLAAQSGGPAIAAYRALGIEVRDAGGEIRDTEEVLEEAMRKLAELSNASERAALASQMFGEDAGPRLAAALGKGIDAMNQARDAARGVIDDSRIAQAVALNKAMGDLSKTIGGSLKAAAMGAAWELAQIVGLTSVLDQDTRKRVNLLRDIERTQERIAMLENAGAIRFKLEGGDRALEHSRNRLKELQQELDELSDPDKIREAAGGVLSELGGESFDKLAAGLREQISLYGQVGNAARIGYQIATGALGDLTAAQQAELLELARTLDDLTAKAQASSLAKNLEEQIALFGKVGEEARISYQIASGALDNISAAEQENLLALARTVDGLNRSAQVAAEFEQTLSRMAGERNAELERQISLTRELTEVERLWQQLNAGAMEGITADQAKQLERIAEEIDALRERNKLLEDVQRITAATRTPLEEYQQTIEELNRIREQSILLLGDQALSEEAYVRAVQQAQERLERLTSTGGSNIGAILGRGIQDAFTGYLMGVETRFEDMLRRMAIQAATSQVFSMLASLSGPVGKVASFLGFGGGRAQGGEINPGRFYIVGERGPELIAPRSAGTVIPNHKLGGLSINVDARGAHDPVAVEQAVERGVRAAVQISGAQTQAMIGQLFRPAMA